MSASTDTCHRPARHASRSGVPGIDRSNTVTRPCGHHAQHFAGASCDRPASRSRIAASASHCASRRSTPPSHPHVHSLGTDDTRACTALVCDKNYSTRRGRGSRGPLHLPFERPPGFEISASASSGSVPGTAGKACKDEADTRHPTPAIPTGPIRSFRPDSRGGVTAFMPHRLSPRISAATVANIERWKPLFERVPYPRADRPRPRRPPTSIARARENRTPRSVPLAHATPLNESVRTIKQKNGLVDIGCHDATAPLHALSYKIRAGFATGCYENVGSRHHYFGGTAVSRR